MDHVNWVHCLVDVLKTLSSNARVEKVTLEIRLGLALALRLGWWSVGRLVPRRLGPALGSPLALALVAWRTWSRFRTARLRSIEAWQIPWHHFQMTAPRGSTQRWFDQIQFADTLGDWNLDQTSRNSYLDIVLKTHWKKWMQTNGNV